MRQSYRHPKKKNLRYCETVVELRPEFLEVHLSLNNKTLFCQAAVFIDLYPTNKAEYSFEFDITVKRIVVSIANFHP